MFILKDDAHAWLPMAMRRGAGPYRGKFCDHADSRQEYGQDPSFWKVRLAFFVSYCLHDLQSCIISFAHHLLMSPAAVLAPSGADDGILIVFVRSSLLRSAPSLSLSLQACV